MTLCERLDRPRYVTDPDELIVIVGGGRIRYGDIPCDGPDGSVTSEWLIANCLCLRHWQIRNSREIQRRAFQP